MSAWFLLLRKRFFIEWLTPQQPPLSRGKPQRFARILTTAERKASLSTSCRQVVWWLGQGGRCLSQKDRDSGCKKKGQIQCHWDIALFPVPFNSASKRQRRPSHRTQPRFAGHWSLKDTFLKYPTDFRHYCLKLFASYRLYFSKNIILSYSLTTSFSLINLLCCFSPFLIQKKKSFWSFLRSPWMF